MFWFSLQLLSETFLILRGNERDMMKNVYWSSCTVPVILVRYYCNLYVLERFSKNSEISHFMKIRPMGAELLHEGRRAGGRAKAQTDMTKLIVAFRNLAHTPINTIRYTCITNEGNN